MNSSGSHTKHPTCGRHSRPVFFISNARRQIRSSKGMGARSFSGLNRFDVIFRAISQNFYLGSVYSKSKTGSSGPGFFTVVLEALTLPDVRQPVDARRNSSRGARGETTGGNHPDQAAGSSGCRQVHREDGEIGQVHLSVPPFR